MKNKILKIIGVWIALVAIIWISVYAFNSNDLQNQLNQVVKQIEENSKKNAPNKAQIDILESQLNFYKSLDKNAQEQYTILEAKRQILQDMIDKENWKVFQKGK